MTKKTAVATAAPVVLEEAPKALPAITAADKFYNLVELAIEKGTGVEQLERLMELNAKWEAAQAKTAFLEAKSAFQSALPVVKKLKTASFDTKGGGRMEYSFSSLDDLAEAIKPYLVEYGFSYRWNQSFGDNGAIRIQCVLTHVGGHSETCEMVGPADNSGHKNALQAVASAVSYMRRHTLTGVTGLTPADEDIDGRLPGGVDTPKTESESLNGLLTPEDLEDKSEAISFSIFEAHTLEELKTAGEPINTLPEGKEKEGLKAMYLKKLKEIRGSDNGARGE